MSAEPPAVRASDAERERTVELLRAHAGDGRLTLEELTQRIEAAYAAQTREQLDGLTADLPASTVAPVPAQRRRPTSLTWVAFGDVQRKGRWRVAGHSRVFVSFGNADVDLRHAQIDGDSATITAYVAFGNVSFYVPEGVEIDHGGLAIFGARGDHGRDVTPPQDAPFLRIRVFTMFGNSDLWRIPAGVTGTFRELTRAVRGLGKVGA